MDIRTLDTTTFGTPLAVYEAIQQAIRHGRLDMDYLRWEEFRNPLNGQMMGGDPKATLVTAYLPHGGYPMGRMLRWWVPVHGGGTRLVAIGGQP